MRTAVSKVIIAVLALRAGCLWALPTLQLDIVGGYYDPFTQSTVTASDSFTLRALLKSPTLLSDTFYVSAAIEPGLPLTPQLPLFGGVEVNGVTYSSTQNAAAWNWGSPPVEAVDDANGGGAGNLAPHGVFPTYYLEFEFQFNPANTVAAYNTQDDATAPGVLYYQDFSIDIAGLVPGYRIDFDLYNQKLKNGDIVLGKFAPFSHDAKSGIKGPDVVVPDGGATLLLIGCGLLGAAIWRRLLGR